MGWIMDASMAVPGGRPIIHHVSPGRVGPDRRGLDLESGFEPSGRDHTQIKVDLNFVKVQFNIVSIAIKEMRVHAVIGRCPICQSELTCTRLHCRGCGTTIEGEFSLGPLQRLSQEQIQFIEALVRNRGSLKDVGAELGMSYPTVNSRLNDILVAMGHGDRVKVPDGAEAAERKREILNQVRDGEISAADAARLLRERA